MNDPRVAQIAEVLCRRNALDDQIAAVLGRPMTAGHLGEWIAAGIFGIELEASAVAPGVDGHFTSGPLQGRTVNVKWHLKREGLLDLTNSEAVDFYLVLAGPPSAAVSSRGSTRPWCITSVYLFHARQVCAELLARGVRIGTASSVTAAQWAAAEIYPHPTNAELPVTPEQAQLLRLFAPSAG